MQTLLTERRVESLKAAVALVENVPGLIIEVGVYKGGSLRAIADVAGDRTIYGFDTFKGLPDCGIYDFHPIGDFSAGFKEVSDRFAGTRVTLFEDIFPPTRILGDIAFAHIDVDQYRSTLNSLKYVAELMPVGGVIVCDDYGHESCKGARRAVHEFLHLHNEFVTIGIVECQITLKRE